MWHRSRQTDKPMGQNRESGERFMPVWATDLWES